MTIFLLMGKVAFSLEIDEKLTIRILDASKSRKTILINRGLEDGLVVGDHAKFFLTTGVVGRGVVVKSSPTRSIWTVYRVIEAEAILKNKVLNIKITKGMQITDDRTRSMIADKKLLDPSESIPLAPGANDMGPSDLNREDQEEVNTLADSSVGFSSMGTSLKTIELYGLLNFNNMSVSSDLEDGNQTSGTVSVLDFSFGIEKYFDMKTSFIGKTSLHLFFHKSSQQAVGLAGTQLLLDVLSYGLGASYHFTNPLQYGKFIGLLTASFGVGGTSDSVQFQSNSVTTEPETLEGSSSSFSLGLGGKYYLRNGFGARLLIDFYQRGEAYSIDDGNEYTKTVTGPRIQMGLSYRF